ncbi:hypothetical protein Tco_0906500 [Tanacetum coccineum]|uniref:CCHC-type domain-containing protein n=1 Tax=Tanacetum coccineum TaxID=301880 RepID=A0ABQ5CGZ4_9ASTR
MSANDKFGLGYGDYRYDGILSYENEVLQSVFMNKESDLENQPLYDSEYESDSEDEHVSLPTKEQETPSFANKQVKTPRETVKNQFTHSKNPKVDKKGLGYGFTTKACFVCGSLSHLIRDCDFHEKRMAKQAELNNRMRKKSKFCCWRENGETAVMPLSRVVIGVHNDITSTKFLNTMVDQDLLEIVLLAKIHLADSSPILVGDFVDSGCSRHYDWKSKAYLVIIKTFNVALLLLEELPDANQVLLRIPRQNNMYSFNLENIVPSRGLACLIAKATIDESNKWHRRTTLYCQYGLLILQQSRAQKQIMQVSKGPNPNWALCILRVSSFDIGIYSDSDYAGEILTGKSTKRGLSISWQETYFLAMHKEDKYGYFYYRGKNFVAAANCLMGNYLGYRESLGRALDGTEALLLPKLFILWLAKVRILQKIIGKQSKPDQIRTREWKRVHKIRENAIKVRILQKSQENGQSRTNMDTGTDRVYKSQEFDSKKGQKSTPVNL